jgi:hypothetical protein
MMIPIIDIKLGISRFFFKLWMYHNKELDNFDSQLFHLRSCWQIMLGETVIVDEIYLMSLAFFLTIVVPC